ncbi:MAG TPA: hypothetical protein VIM69_07900, partial [Opitutaceae bacterium]
YRPSIYRWWLASLSWLDQKFRGKSLGQSMEDSALVADPILHLILFLGVVIFTARTYGAWSAGLASVAMVALFPFAAEYLPGLCSDRGLAQLASFASLLLLGAGIVSFYSESADTQRKARIRFLLAGIFGGVGMWISVWNEVPIIFGIFVGAAIALFCPRDAFSKKEAAKNQRVFRGSLWRYWSVGGAVAILASYLIENFPDHLLGWEFHAAHPFYALAWLGFGELLVRAAAWKDAGQKPKRLIDIVLIIFAVAAVASLIVAMQKTKNWGFWEHDLAALRIARLPNGASASNFGSWFFREGLTPPVWTTGLPALAIIAGAYLFWRSKNTYAWRRAIGTLLGPTIVLLGLACWQLNYWNDFDATIIVLTIVAVAALAQNPQIKFGVYFWCAGTIAVVVLSLCLLLPSAKSGGGEINEREFFGLVERDLARWLTNRCGANKPTALAPHSQSTTLYYYGRFPGLATLSRENKGGFEGAMRIVSASTPEEAKELIDKRGIEYIIIPSWDSYLDTYARAGMGQLEGTFLSDLHNWKLPSWLRPIPYQLPTFPGFEGQNVTVFQVVDDQDDSAALSRIAEYFVEMGQLDTAAKAGLALRRFPADFGALVARAQVEGSHGESEAFVKLVEQLKTRLKSNSDRSLQWDRRITLAVILARAKQSELARAQTERCVSQVTEERLRSASTAQLYHLLVLAQAFHIQIADPKLHELALDLLPVDLQQRLENRGQ